MQGHPEFWPELIIEKIAPCLKKKGILSAEELEQSAQNMLAMQLDSAKVCSIIRKFLLRSFDQAPGEATQPLETSAPCTLTSPHLTVATDEAAAAAPSNGIDGVGYSELEAFRTAPSTPSASMVGAEGTIPEPSESFARLQATRVSV